MFRFWILKFGIIWKKIGQVMRWRNDFDFSETSLIFLIYINSILKHLFVRYYPLMYPKRNSNTLIYTSFSDSLSISSYQFITFISSISPSIYLSIYLTSCPVGWDYRIHRLQFCQGIRPPKRVSCIWHEKIWWRGSSNAGALGNAEYPFIAIAPRSTLARIYSTW